MGEGTVSAKGGRGLNRVKPDLLNTAIRELDYSKIKITSKGIDVVEKHLARFGHDGPNSIMLKRLRDIEKGLLKATEYDLKFYAHEAREYARYRNGGYETGVAPDDFYQTQHGATLEDYKLPDDPRQLYHPEAQAHPDF